jgi:hypothetical protein
MAERRAFLLRIEPELYDALQRWASDELRSINAQIEFVLRREATRAGRLKKPRGEGKEESDESKSA